MATGVLAQVAPAATTYTLVYTSNTTAAVSINFLNRDSVAVTARIAVGTIADNSSPATTNFIEYDVSIPANGVIERTGLVLNTGQKIVVYASTANTTVSVYGIET